MLDMLRRLPKASRLLPFILMFYKDQSEYLWADSEATLHSALQWEGCEQGDPLSPALFSLGMHEALVRSRVDLYPDDFIVAYLDDVDIRTIRARARSAFQTVSRHIEMHAGIRVHLGKTQCWSRAGGEPPPGIASLNEAGKDFVWTGDLEDSKNGMVVLGSPIGCYAFVKEHGKKRLQEER